MTNDLTKRLALTSAVFAAAFGCRGAERDDMRAVARVEAPTSAHDAAHLPEAPVELLFVDDDIARARDASPGGIGAARRRIFDAIDGLVRAGQVPAFPIGVYVAVKPRKRARIWIEVFYERPDDHMAPEQLELLRTTMEAVAVTEVRDGPMLYAAIHRPNGALLPDPPLPKVWKDAFEKTDDRLPQPDALLQVLWPDPDEPGWQEAHSERGGFRVQMPDIVHESDRAWTTDAGEKLEQHGLVGIALDGTSYVARCTWPLPRDYVLADGDVAEVLEIVQRAPISSGEGAGLEFVLAARSTGTRAVARGLVFRGARSSTLCQLQIVPRPAAVISSARMTRFLDSFQIDVPPDDRGARAQAPGAAAGPREGRPDDEH